MKNLKDMLRNNLLLKIASLVFAFLIWAFVENISNPEITGTVTVGLEVRNDEVLTDNNQTYTLDTESVKVSYSLRSNSQRLVKAQNFSAYVDMMDYSVTGAVPIYVEVDEAVSSLVGSISQNPLVAHVRTEDLVEADIPLSYRLTGEAARGMYIEYVELSADHVTVYGPASEIARISQAEIAVDISGASTDFSGEGEIYFLDERGGRVETGSLFEVRTKAGYYAFVYRNGELPVAVSYTGSPGEGYIVTGTKVSPDRVRVKGSDSAIAAAGSVSIPGELIYIDGATADMSFGIDISPYLADGLELEGNGHIDVTVSVSADPDFVPPTEEEVVEENEDGSLEPGGPPFVIGPDGTEGFEPSEGPGPGGESIAPGEEIVEPDTGGETIGGEAEPGGAAPSEEDTAAASETGGAENTEAVGPPAAETEAPEGPEQ